MELREEADCGPYIPPLLIVHCDTEGLDESIITNYLLLVFEEQMQMTASSVRHSKPYGFEVLVRNETAERPA